MATEQPKKPMTAFFLFTSDNREAIVKELKGQATVKGLVVKTASEKWSKLPQSQKAPFEKRAAQLKAEYDKALASFLEGGGKVIRKSKKDKESKPKKDKDAPKKPTGGGYGVYLSENREKIMKGLPAGSKCFEVTKIAGAQWAALPESQKATFATKFHAKMEEYKVAMEKYKASKPEVEEEDEEEEEDEDDEQEEAEGKDVANTAPASKKRARDAMAGDAEDPPSAKRGSPAKDPPSAKRGSPAKDSKLFEEAKTLGLQVKLKSLTENPKVNKSVTQCLQALKDADGSVVAAKKALLGA